MTVGMGIRVGSSAVHFAVFNVLPDGTVEPFLIDKITVPEATDNPHKLSYIRTNLLSIIMRFNVTNAGIRISENTAQTISNFRLYLEGVIQELFVDSSVEKYFLGNKATLARLLGVTTADITGYIDGVNDIANIPDIPKSHLEKRESILTGLGSLEL
ncbi:hypothetical protein [Cohnella phaseoli]|uniref:Uncharacterized protein n=1 Tax=Cohnella phaseoli TaxID=456490 RepID=A0A3D9KBH1_9BACL|nr:hypothetical protein [Cohnella phaseoli]RED83279.1 hypothetical protein DFP98_108122 [Cohnella phaseoli]